MKNIILIASILILLSPKLLLAVEENVGPPGRSAIQEEIPKEFCDPFANEVPDLVSVSDPFESFNRAAFWFNDKIYRYILNPILSLAQNLPETTLEKASALYQQVFSPKIVANAVFDLKFRDAGHEIRRLLFAGIAGLGKLSESTAAKEELFVADNRYARNEEIYLILPVLGPFTLEDLTDTYLNMPESVQYSPESKPAIGIKGRLKIYQCIRKDALDPYLFMRSTFEQRREAEARKIART